MGVNFTKLKSGLNIITYKMAKVQSVAINLIVKAGSRYEAQHEHGISHFLEHMAFKGTKTRSAKKIAEEFDAIGGLLNAYTSLEQTVYFAKVLKKDVNLALEIIADIIQNSLFNCEDIVKESQVICQEIAHSFDNPDDVAFEKLYEYSFLNQPLGRSVLGTYETIKKINKLMIKKYVQKHYHADNLYLSLAGDINHNQIVLLAQKLFTLPKANYILPNKAYFTSGMSIVEKSLEQATIIVGFESIAYSTDVRHFYHIQMLALILGGGVSSRLFQTIREELGLAYSVGSHNSTYSDIGIFSLYANTAHERVQEVIEKLAQETKKICSDISMAELERAKSQIKANILMAEDSVNYKSEDVGKSFVIYGRYISTNELIKYISQTLKSDIISAARRLFSTKPTISIIGSKLSNINYDKICELFCM